ncbi:MAG: hypothetical protein R6V07_17740 [Armatimonadota bacterium]
MPAINDGAESRPGCLAGRFFAGAVRLVLVYPLASIGSLVGQRAQAALLPQVGTPYEGALAGIIVGALIGLSLWRAALAEDGWRPRMADATLATVSAVWLAGLVIVWSTQAPSWELLIPWAACLGGAAGIAALLRA